VCWICRQSNELPPVAAQSEHKPFSLTQARAQRLPVRAQASRFRRPGEAQGGVGRKCCRCHCRCCRTQHKPIRLFASAKPGPSCKGQVQQQKLRPRFAQPESSVSSKGHRSYTQPVNMSIPSSSDNRTTDNFSFSPSNFNSNFSPSMVEALKT
jgi:hypothetical protein